MKRDDVIAAAITAGIVIGGGYVEPADAQFVLPSGTAVGGVLNKQGPPVTTSACGTPTIPNNTTDFAGRISAGAQTSCTVLFNAVKAAVPNCFAQDETTPTSALKVVPTSSGFTVSGLTASDVFSYLCLGNPS